MRTRATLIGLVLGMGASLHAQAETLTVCAKGCDYTSINAAIADAADGDIIQLGAETYLETATVDTLGKSIEVRGTLDAERQPTSILDGSSFSGTVLRVQTSPEPVVLEGLLIRNGNGSFRGGGIDATNAAIHMSDCVVEQCTAPYGGGIHLGLDPEFIYLPPSTVRRSTFRNNSSQHWCETFTRPANPKTGLPSEPHLVEDCTFLNSSSYHGGVLSGGTTFLRCRFAGSSGTLAEAGIFSSNTSIQDCVFEDHSGGATLGSVGSVGPYTGVTITHCLFRNNSGTQLVYPGGSDAVLTGSLFCDTGTLYNDAVTDGGGNLEFASCPFDDCNENGIDDILEIALDPAITDEDQNWIPDCCEAPACPGDVTNDGEVDAADLGILLAVFGTDGSAVEGTDLNDDSAVDASDLGLLLGYWGLCPEPDGCD